MQLSEFVMEIGYLGWVLKSIIVHSRILPVIWLNIFKRIILFSDFQVVPVIIYIRYLKFLFSKKATKFDKIFTDDLTLK